MPRIHICFSKIARKPQRNLFERSFNDDIREALDPKAQVERYGRNWRFAKWKERNGYLVGKFGFSSQGTEMVTDYDDAAQDFVELQVNSKLSSCALWVLDTQKQVLAFEIKPPLIEYQSFKGAFEGFLQLHPDAGLTFEDYVETARFLAWVKNDIERIISFKANLRTPNPDYSKDTDYILATLEQTNADTARVEFHKLDGSGDSLNTEGTIEQIVKYGETGYSSIKAEGKKGDLTKTYDSKKRIHKERVSVIESIADDAKWDIIIERLRKFVNEK